MVRGLEYTKNQSVTYSAKLEVNTVQMFKQLGHFGHSLKLTYINLPYLLENFKISLMFLVNYGYLKLEHCKVFTEVYPQRKFWIP